MTDADRLTDKRCERRYDIARPESIRLQVQRRSNGRVENLQGELHDLSMENPEIMSELLEAYRLYVEKNEVFDHEGVFDALYRKAYGVD